ncbi:MAG TPA: TerB family tellurite resistance protein [Candidatus Limnocylindrales bacterium]
MFRRYLGVGSGDAGEAAASTPSVAGTADETATVRRIVERLESLPPERARYLAGYAYILSRAAHADLDISEAETRTIERYVVEHGGLDEAQAVIVVEMAKLQARHQGATEDYLVTREFRNHATPEQRLDLLRSCFAIAAADQSIGGEESAAINQIASELDIDREDLRRLRAEHASLFSAIRRPDS